MLDDVAAAAAVDYDQRGTVVLSHARDSSTFRTHNAHPLRTARPATAYRTVVNVYASV